VLPETSLEDGVAFAEKMRSLLVGQKFPTSVGPLAVTSNFGVAAHQLGARRRPNDHAAPGALTRACQRIPTPPNLVCGAPSQLGIR